MWIKHRKKINLRACYLIMVSCAMWKTWPSGLSKDKNLGLRPWFLSTECLARRHVFHTARETMIKSYNTAWTEKMMRTTFPGGGRRGLTTVPEHHRAAHGHRGTTDNVTEIIRKSPTVQFGGSWVLPARQHSGENCQIVEWKKIKLFRIIPVSCFVIKGESLWIPSHLTHIGVIVKRAWFRV